MVVAGFQATGLVEVTRHWPVQRAAAAWLAQIQTVCQSGQGRLERPGYQLYMMPSVLSVCQGKRDLC